MKIPEISIVVPMYNEEGNIEMFYRRVVNVLDSLGKPFEIICINDGSRDGTLYKLNVLHQKDPRVKIINLSRNFGKEIAMTAGLDYSSGEAVIPIDADLQDPPELIPRLIAQWREGYDVVYATRVRRHGENWLKKITAGAFYNVAERITSISIPQNTGDFRLMSRPVVEALKQIRERHRFMKGLFTWVGFHQTSISYDRDPRFAGRTKWNYWKLWNFALEGITSFSYVPLQAATYSGILISLVAFIYATIVFIRTLVFGNPVPGYPSLMVIVLFLGGVQLFTLGVIGEYIGRIYNESKRRPLYFVQGAQGFAEIKVHGKKFSRPFHELEAK